MTKIKLLKYLIIAFLLIPSLFFAKTEQFGDKQIFIDFGSLPFNLNNLIPGKSETKEITIDNHENFDISVYLGANKISEKKNLASVLLLSFDKDKPISLSELFKEGIFVANIPRNSSKNISLEIVFLQNSGNEFQAGSLGADFKINVTQIGDSHETFGSVVLPGIYNSSPNKEDSPMNSPENNTKNENSTSSQPENIIQTESIIPVSPLSPTSSLSPLYYPSSSSSTIPIYPISPLHSLSPLPLQSNLFSILPPVILNEMKDLVDNSNETRFFLILLFFILLLILLLILLWQKRRERE
ncbi:MAG: hypothetical protein WC242_03045 [Candidatus Paceibacterota bacterium]|jgi:hypothetical protein